MITLLSLISLGFFLGMRHATDPDHVLAVSTIVTRQRTLRAALLIGILWGVGHPLTIVVVGLLHGLAGSAAVALLVLAIIQTPGWAVAYLVLFGLGTIVGMMLITVAVAAPMLYTARRLSGIDRRLRIASGLLSLGFGLFLVYQIGFVHGLFTGRPSGSPE